MSQRWHHRTYDRLRRIMVGFGAARIGESAVISLCVHMTDAYQPGRVRVVTTADAGRVFYGRCRRGEVFHIDIFHEVGDVDHRNVAMAIVDVVSRTELAGDEEGELLDLIDVQTATGGGRISGDLSYGTKESLRRAHCNHVHVAVRARADVYPVLLPIVDAVEEVISEVGLEIRKVESVSCQRGLDGPAADLSPYSGPSDSHLKEPRAEDADSGSGKGSATGQEGGSERREGEAEPLYADPLLDTLDLAGDIGGLQDLRLVLDHIDRRGEETDDRSVSGWDRQTLLETLKAKGFVDCNGKKLTLSRRGRRLYNYIRDYYEEILRMMRRLARKAPPLHLQPESRGGSQHCRPGRRGRRTRLVVDRDADGADELSAVDTVMMSRRRSLDDAGWRCRPGDLRYFMRRSIRSSDVCLLIDASASMSGKRLRAARHLAHHLVLTSRDRVAVVLFQERATRIICPFTRDRRLLERTISGMQAFGLTPLAGAINDTLNYIKSSRSYSPLLLLITDGVPTIPYWTLNPLVDAVQAAKAVARRRLPFVCIGLEPNRSFLDKLAAAGAGNLYIVDELDRDLLVAIARKERAT